MLCCLFVRNFYYFINVSFTIALPAVSIVDVVTVVTFTIAGRAEDFLDDCHNVLLVYFAVRTQGEINFTGCPWTCPVTLDTVALITIQDAIPFTVSAERTFFNTLGCFGEEDFNFSHCLVV